jgi:hypothetical protein
LVWLKIKQPMLRELGMRAIAKRFGIGVDTVRRVLVEPEV